MKKFVKFVAAAAALTAGVSSAQAANTASASATAVIIAPVSVAKNTDLDFGSIAANLTASGDVTIDAAGARNCGVGLACSGSTTAAGFTITGVTGQNVSIGLTDSTIQLTSGANTMDVQLVPSVSSMALDGTDTFAVGGTLTVGAAQAAGNYTGTFQVEVNYQ
jgi:hypothetical protein